MKFIRAVFLGHHRPLSRFLGFRTFAASTEEYAKRNYASNVSEYNTVASYNFLISACGKCKNSEPAIKILEEMKCMEVKPNGQTYICLLNACAATGKIDQPGKTVDWVMDYDFEIVDYYRYAIVRDMTAAGLGLNKFCYAGLIAAHKNKSPITEETTTKIVELVGQSKGWSSVEASSDTAENVMMGVSEEELYGIPTAEFTHRRGFLNRQLTVYHVAFQACADLRSVETMERLLGMLKMDGKTPDTFITMQTMRCYLHSGDIDGGLKVFDDYMSSKAPVVELYVTLIEGAMVGHTPRGMQVAQDTLEKMNSRGFFLNAKMGNELLLAAAGEKGKKIREERRQGTAEVSTGPERIPAVLHIGAWMRSVDHAPKPITSPVPEAWYPLMAALMLVFGLVFTASFFMLNDLEIGCN
ncbi:hypothetical protein Sjap_000856 [Stephania japonica]|uniref:Pentatricopeptide repeat-containing protein n=1 Tax=Stephania japonica TaxID=461633 RepID=A0AAP0KIX0_9MAGN